MNKIFVVDDSIGACIAIERILGSRGFDVVWERLGETGLMTIEKHAPDLVLCDLVMPDIDGYEFCRSVKENPLLDGIPVILMSGIVDDEVRRQAGEIGVDAVVAKPFTPFQLLSVVEGVLDGGAQSAESPTAAGADAEAGGDPVARKEWDPMLETLAAEPALRFAYVLDGTGRVVAVYRRKAEDAVASGQELFHFAQGAVALTQRLGQEALQAVTIEAESEILMLRPLARGHLLVGALDNRCILGKARYLLSRVNRPRKHVT